MDEAPSILLVDDDHRNLLALEAVLNDLGCVLTKASTGRDALRLLLNSSFALIVLDVRIPDMSGFEIAQLLRTHPKWERTPIIFLTAFEGSEELVFESYALGGVDYIVKPVNPRLLRAKVQVFIELHRKTEEARRETERRIRAEEIAALVEELARSNAELEQFACAASHDLQEPLRMITSYAGLLGREYEDKLDERARMYLDYVRNGAVRMKQMVDCLLYYARIGHHGRPFERVDMDAVLAEVLGNMKLTLEETGAQVTSGDLPEVMGDRIELTRVFQNLLSNALKFRKSDHPPIVHFSVERAGGEWRFEVADNGIGIDPRHAERIFAVFQRLHPIDRYQGTGIGLSECKKIVERHGGRIWVESRPNEGSSFYFTLRGRA
jgi:signal transduction histidine kinase